MTNTVHSSPKGPASGCFSAQRLKIKGTRKQKATRLTAYMMTIAPYSVACVVAYNAEQRRDSSQIRRNQGGELISNVW